MKAREIGTLQRWIKRVCYTAALLGALFLVWRYDLESIPSNFPHLSPQRMPPGARVVTMDLHDDTVLGVGSVVIYRAPAGGDALCYGEIAGLPGEALEVSVDEGELGVLVVGGRRETLELPPGQKLASGVIPEGHYLILHGDRIIAGGSAFPDSRRLGLIPRSSIAKKIVVPLEFF
ncbi:MAG: hypothetical protein R3F20_04230 [Planctomycetota bacterium]